MVPASPFMSYARPSRTPLGLVAAVRPRCARMSETTPPLPQLLTRARRDDPTDARGEVAVVAEDVQMLVAPHCRPNSADRPRCGAARCSIPWTSRRHERPLASTWMRGSALCVGPWMNTTATNRRSTRSRVPLDHRWKFISSVTASSVPGSRTPGQEPGSWAAFRGHVSPCALLP